MAKQKKQRKATKSKRFIHPGFRAHPEKINRTGANRKYFPTNYALANHISAEDFMRIVLALKNKAMKGDVNAINSILDRLVGKPPQGIITANMTPALTVDELAGKLNGAALGVLLDGIKNLEDDKS